MISIRCTTYTEARAAAPASMLLSAVFFVDGCPDLRDWVFRSSGWGYS